MRIQDAITHLLLTQPFYGYIAAAASPVENSNIKTMQLSSVPALEILYNKQWFESLKDQHAVGAVIHELLHLLLMHPYRDGGRDMNIWTTACDMAVNEHIDDTMLTGDCITVGKISTELKLDIPAKKSADYYYGLLSNGDVKLSFNSSEDEIRIVMSDGRELKAEKHSEDTASEVCRNAAKVMLSDILSEAEAEGEVPVYLEASLSEIYRSSRVNWRNVLKRYLTGKGKMQVRKTYKKESRRFDSYPGNKRLSGTDALLAIDESGSISFDQTVQFAGELLSLKRITGANIRVTRFDTDCTQPVELHEYVRKPGRQKNGGTDYRPVFKMADDMRIPLVIVFTDGEGPAPEEVNQKVLWVIVKNGKVPAPYGHSVYFSE